MKTPVQNQTLRSIALKVAFLFLLSSGFGITSLQAENDPTKSVFKTVSELIRKKVNYPAFEKGASEEQLVFIEYAVSKEGKVSVIKVNGSDERFNQYAKKQLNGEVVADTVRSNQSKVVKIRFEKR